MEGIGTAKQRLKTALDNLERDLGKQVERLDNKEQSLTHRRLDLWHLSEYGLRSSPMISKSYTSVAQRLPTQYRMSSCKCKQKSLSIGNLLLCSKQVCCVCPQVHV